MQAAVMAGRGRRGPARATWRRRLGVPGGPGEAERGGPAGARRPAPAAAPMARPHGPHRAPHIGGSLVLLTAAASRAGALARLAAGSSADASACLTRTPRLPMAACARTHIDRAQRHQGGSRARSADAPDFRSAGPQAPDVCPRLSIDRGSIHRRRSVSRLNASPVNWPLSGPPHRRTFAPIHQAAPTPSLWVQSCPVTSTGPTSHDLTRSGSVSAKCHFVPQIALPSSTRTPTLRVNFLDVGMQEPGMRCSHAGQMVPLVSKCKDR